MPSTVGILATTTKGPVKAVRCGADVVQRVSPLDVTRWTRYALSYQEPSGRTGSGRSGPAAWLDRPAHSHSYYQHARAPLALTGRGAMSTSVGFLMGAALGGLIAVVGWVIYLQGR